MQSRDRVQQAVERLVRELVLEGYPRPHVTLRVCECGHEDGAHHGRGGDLRCDDCSCEAFVLAPLEVAA